MNKVQIKEVAIGIGIFLIGCLLVIGGIKTTFSGTKEEEKVQLEVALRRAMIECYALEGAYPPDVAYMEENYGVVIDESQFIVHYSVFAENIMPDFKVIGKDWEE